MIAYNHTIEFIPALQRGEEELTTSMPRVTIRENKSTDFRKLLYVYMKFLNNQGRDTLLYSDRTFAPTQKGQLWAFEIKDIVTLFWYSGTLELEYQKQDNFTDELLEYWTLHIALPFFFTIEETYDFLHAGAVEIEGKPILFVAESFGGKSTMTDFFIKQGHVMISDDKVACYENDEIFFSVPSIPYHRPYRKMEDLGYFIENVAQKPKPIHAIYELDKAEADAPITISKLQGIEKFKSLRYSSEINLSFLKSKRFVFLSRLAKVVPVYRVTVPWDMGRLGEVHKTILEHSLRQGSSYPY